MLLESLRKGRAGEADDAKRRVIHLGQPVLPADGEPDLEGVLGGHLVEPEGREKADDSMGYPPGGLHQALVFADLRVRHPVEPAADLFHEAAGVKPAKLLTAESLLLQITGAEHSGGADQRKETFLRGGGHAL